VPKRPPDKHVTFDGHEFHVGLPYLERDYLRYRDIFQPLLISPRYDHDLCAVVGILPERETFRFHEACREHGFTLSPAAVQAIEEIRHPKPVLPAEVIRPVLRPFQTSGVIEMLRILREGGVLLADEIGCVSGDMLVSINRAGITRKMTVRELYEGVNGLSLRKWREDIPTFVKSLRDDGTLRLNTVVAAVESGEKRVVLLTLESGKSIRLTPDHLVATEDGWIAAGDLCVGAQVLTDGEPVCPIYGEIISVPRKDRVVSVRSDGITDTYDLVMEDPYRNFVANGIVVHNCGKTLESLSVLETLDAYPAVVVCPASIKIGWQRQVERWLPHRSVTIVSGRRNASIPKADLIVVNYDVLADNLSLLCDVKPNAAVFDELHLAKNFAARRARACVRLSDTVDHVIGVTGTPVINRPLELWSQLVILRRTWCSMREYLDAYCETSANHDDLRARVASFMVRRTRAEVSADMPSVTWARVPVILDNMTEYLAAEREFRNWLGTNRYILDSSKAGMDGGGGAVAREYMAHMSRLRGLVARGKIKPAREWVGNFLESGEKLILFAHHRELQRALHAAFPQSAKVFGGDPQEQRWENIQRFVDDPDCRLIVLSLRGAQAGLDGLQYASSNALLVESDWNPAGNDQAAGRMAREGQRSPCIAWLMVAEGTIDERVVRIVERKRSLIDTIIGADGAGAELLVGQEILGETE